MARIIVCGYMIRFPLAGNILAYFHYVLGLSRLGYEVLYLEESGWPQSCYDPITKDYSDDPRTGLYLVQEVMRDHNIDVPVCYVNRDTGSIEGTDWADLKRMLGAADVLLNIGGVCWLSEFRLCRRRVLIDMDPFFTQIGKFGTEGFEGYHSYFSYGANIGRQSCTIPTHGVDWHATIPPVVPEIWQTSCQKHVRTKEIDAPFTTVANWSAYGAATYRGEQYGQKDEEFLRLLALPTCTSQKLELALSGASSEIQQQFAMEGWSVIDAQEVSTDMAMYKTYLATSRGEFSVAKNAYVKTYSGWFSDRSICYLATGRPVILQDTGFSEWLSATHGVLAFSSLAEAARCIERVNADYLGHSNAARAIAEQTFNYKVVLPRLVETN